MTALADGAKATDLLVFSIAGYRFGVPALNVVELTLAVAVTALPRPATTHEDGQDDGQQGNVIEGLVDYHGELAAVINLRPKFGERSQPLDHKEHFVFLRLGHSLVALRVDRAEEIAAAPQADSELVLDLYQQTLRNPGRGVRLSPALHHNSDLSGMASGVARLSNDLVYIFDLKTLLTGAESADLVDILHRARQNRLVDTERRVDGV